MPTIQIIKEPIANEDLKRVARELFGDLAKAVVDIEKRIMALGGELHADAEALLIEQGSDQKDLWGINLYPEATGDDWLEYDSMINIRPGQNNRSRGVEDPAIRELIRSIVNSLIIRKQ